MRALQTLSMNDSLVYFGEIVGFVLIAWALATVAARLASDWSTNPRQGLLFIMVASIAITSVAAFLVL